MIQPLTVVQRIGDKLIRDTPFRYRLEVAPVNRSFSNETSGGMQFVDFGRTFGLGRHTGGDAARHYRCAGAGVFCQSVRCGLFGCSAFELSRPGA